MSHLGGKLTLDLPHGSVVRRSDGPFYRDDHGRPVSGSSPFELEGFMGWLFRQGLLSRFASVSSCSRLVAAAMVAMSAPAIAAPGDEIYLRPRQLVAADGAKLNLYCTGAGSPTVVFDSGHQDWAPAWAVVQPEVSKWTRACSFDRPGYGFSPAGPLPRTSERIATELHDALHADGIQGPFVLVGHAFGATNMRTFADLYPNEIEGMVLIDPDPIDSGTAEQIGTAHRIYIDQAIQIQRCRDTLADHLPQPPELACDKRFFRGFPDPAWSDAVNAALAAEVRTRPDLSDAANAELEEIPVDELWLRQHHRSLGATPVRVITASQHRPETIAAQARLLDVSSDAKQIFAQHSRNAYVQFDEPRLVIEAIREAARR
jgi:pimeloyl-ACP methyl ester carboxylesterase